MTRERRSLWGSISTSRKVNAVSLGAALLYTWAIPHFDDEGFLDGETEQILAKIVPLRPEFRGGKLKKYVSELENIKLWRIFRDDRRIIIYDPAFDSHQIFRGITKKPSKLRTYIWTVNPQWFTCQPNTVDPSTPPTTRGKTATREVKYKGSEEPIVEIFVENLKEENPEPPKETLEQGVARIKKIEEEKGHYL